MDKFFSQTNCDKCGGSLENGRIMSMYSTACICMDCKEKEMKRSDYKKAVKAEYNEIKKGNYNYRGIDND